MSDPKNTMKQAIAARLGGEVPSFSPEELVRGDTINAAIISKLTKSARDTAKADGADSENLRPIIDSVRQFTQRDLALSVQNNQIIMEMLPNIKRAATILTASVLSPKDMMTIELNYGSKTDFIPTDLLSKMNNVVKDYFEKDYKITPTLPKVLMDMLFLKGSYPIAIIPENAIDEVINGQGAPKLENISEVFIRDSSENLKVKHLGFLKNPEVAGNNRPKTTLESLLNYNGGGNYDPKLTFKMGNSTYQTNIDVIDNVHVLKMPSLVSRLRSNQAGKLMGNPIFESLDSVNSSKLTNIIYRQPKVGLKPIASIKTGSQLTRHSIGNALIINLPAESVIPAYIPGTPDLHVGYYVVLDIDGNPITVDGSDLIPNPNYGVNSATTENNMLKMAKATISGFDIGNINHLNQMGQLCGTLIEQDLIERLKSGYMVSDVKLAKSEIVYRLMLARSLSNQMTQLLYIPAENLTYFANEYKVNGVGKSMLDDNRVLFGLRILLMLSDLNASIRNSIGQTKVTVKLDQEDTDPLKRVEDTMELYAATRAAGQLPLNCLNPRDLTDWLARANINFAFEGNSRIPDMSVDVAQSNSNYPKIDSDLAENLDKQLINSTGITPEMIDASYQSEFAIGVAVNNIMVSRVVQQIQDTFTPKLSEHCGKVLLNSNKALNELKKIIENNYADILEQIEISDTNEIKASDLTNLDENDKTVLSNRILLDYIRNLSVTLPSPNSTSTTSQKDSIEAYSELLEACLDHYLNPDFLNENNIGEIASEIDTFKAMFKSYFMRKRMAEEGIMNELGDLLATNNKGDISNTTIHDTSEFVSAIGKTLVELKRVVELNKRDTTEMAEDTGVADVLENGGGSSSTSSSSDSESGGDDGNADDGATTTGDDFDMGDDLGDAGTGEENGKDEKKKDGDETNLNGE